MHHLSPMFREGGTSLHRSSGCQDLVSVALNCFATSTACAAANSFQFQPCGRTSHDTGGILIVLTPARKGSYSHLDPLFTAWTTRVSNPFAPHAFAPQRQLRPAGRLRHLGSSHLRIPPLLHWHSAGLITQICSFESKLGSEPPDFTPQLQHRRCPPPHQVKSVDNSMYYCGCCR